jgi:transcription antitermination protein NusB
MKTPKDPRHLERIKVMQLLFSWDFNHHQEEELGPYREIINNLEKIDSLITEAAPSWPLEKVNKLDLAILRLATYELVISKKTPIKVIIDEAVELAKEYGSDSSPSFVNGALGKMVSNPEKSVS